MSAAEALRGVSEHKRLGGRMLGENALQQDPLEFAFLLGIYEQHQPSRVLEIGSAAGASLYYWLTRAPSATVGGIDLRTPKELIMAFRSRLIFGRGDSHSPGMLDWIEEQLAPLDWLFIDGDHSYEGVRMDYETYGRLMNPGGLIVFHDIFVTNTPSTQVWKFWRELNGEEIGATEKKMGYGIIRT